MVATLSKLSDAGAAAQYYEAGDDYYTQGGKAPSRWYGRGADTLGLNGEVTPDTFTAMLEGRLPDGTVLGATRSGVREHKPGWDVALSPPKSVSVLALVAGDRRLLDAQDRAAHITFAYVERHGAATRIRDGEEVERIATENLVIAAFPHVTARATDAAPAPQVHTHGVILNMTMGADGKWRSIESRDFYRLQKDVGGIYHQALATEIIQLGYTVTFNEDGTFEIDGVPLDVRKGFSGRSAQIEAALDARGQSRATATPAQKAVAALDTRAPKEKVDQRELIGAWRAQADALGFTEDVRRTIVADSEARAAGLPVSTPHERRLAADRALAFAVEHVAERDAVFSAAVLERVAGDAARGHVPHGDIITAIARAKQRGAIVARAVPGRAKGAIGFATREAVATEERMLALEAGGRTRFASLVDRMDAGKIIGAAVTRSADQGHTWTQGQRDATRGLLLSTASVTAIQGAAGTAKTTTVLATFADAARDKGFEVRALAPTATAAKVLGDAIGAEGMTVAKMLGTDTAPRGEREPEVWVVDEASMLSARDAAALLARAQEADARLVLVGDVAQLGSVEAGRSFGQLQDRGMATFKLEEIVRQSDAHTREAVEAMLAGDAAKAFAALDAGGGAIIEQPDTQTRHAILARDFTALSREDRAKTLVLDPTRQGRQDLTDAIRAALVTDGTLGREAMIATVLESRDLTQSQARRAASYRPGDIVTFRKSDRGRPRAGVGHRVEAIDTATGTVRLVPDKGARQRAEPKPIDWQPARWGADAAETFTEVEQEFRAGDQVQFTRNNYRAERLNGQTAEVVAIDPQGANMVLQREDGRIETLDFRHVADRHIRPGWVRTIHSAQGATCDRVMAHLEAFRANTVNTRSVYVAISRARLTSAVYTDNRTALVEALGVRDGAQVGALDETINRPPTTLGEARLGLGA